MRAHAMPEFEDNGSGTKEEPRRCRRVIYDSSFRLDDSSIRPRKADVVRHPYASDLLRGIARNAISSYEVESQHRPRETRVRVLRTAKIVSHDILFFSQSAARRGENEQAATLKNILVSPSGMFRNRPFSRAVVSFGMVGQKRGEPRGSTIVAGKRSLALGIVAQRPQLQGQISPLNAQIKDKGRQISPVKAT